MALKIYLDTSVLVALFARDDEFNSRAEDFLLQHHPVLVVSDLAGVEFASAMARRVRMKDLTAAEARTAFRSFDRWKAGSVETIEMQTADLTKAEVNLRRLDLGLRTADAIHLAIAARLGIEVATFDKTMALAAQAIGMRLAAV